MKTQLIRLLAALAFCASLYQAAAQGTAFTYQGQLMNGANPASGTYNMTFALYNASTGGSQTGSLLTNNAVGVTNGLFTVSVDFGAVFNGTPYWLQIGVRTNGNNVFIALTPRQPLTPTPYAIYAESSGSSALVNDPGTQDLFAGQNAGNQAQPGNYNTGVGYGALDVNTGSYNSAVGNEALGSNITGDSDTAGGVFALQHNTTGSGNTAYGADVLASNVSGNNNTAVGDSALESSTSGSNNVAIGMFALNKGADNNLVAVGYQALENDVVVGGLFGSGANTAIGYQALQLDNTGSGNTAIGYQVLNQDTSGYNNTAIGFGGLLNNTTGFNNVANGFAALLGNTTGSNNVANGYNALNANQAGSYNLAAGGQALDNNTTGNFNTAVGDDAMKLNVTGGTDVAVGYQAMEDGTALNYSTAVGYQSLRNSSTVLVFNCDGLNDGSICTNGDYNTALGYQALLNTTAGSYNIAIGYRAGESLTTGAYNIDIGDAGNATDSGTIRIGTQGVQSACYIAGTVYANGVALTSDRNAKENFKPVDSQTVLAKVASLPVSEWNYKTDSQGVQHIGPMAQDFQAAFQLSADDKHISVVDEGGVALAAIQGLNAKVDEKDAEIELLKQSVAELKRMMQTVVEKK